MFFEEFITYLFLCFVELRLLYIHKQNVIYSINDFDNQYYFNIYTITQLINAL